MMERFVAREIGGRGKARFQTRGVADGSYNIIFRFRFDTAGSPDAVLRLPKPGFSAAELVAEKLENEALWMKYMEEHHVLKVPHVHSWSSQGPDGIGPYILMDYVEGESLLDQLAEWRRSDEPKRDFVFEQVAEMYLRLHGQRFDRIGSITKTPEGAWAVTKRPLTLDMHQQVLGIPGFPTGSWPSGPLSDSQDYKVLLVDIHWQQLHSLRNLNIPVEKVGLVENVVQEGDKIDMARAMEIARARWIARRAFATSATSFGDHADGCIPFCCDFHPRNMLVDPDTAEITAVLDLEGTNAMPAGFARDPPLWLDTAALERALLLDRFPEWQARFEAALGPFLKAMERVEARQERQEPGLPLSARMRTSWESKQCLVNFAACNSDCFDALYWALPDVFPPPDESSTMEKEVEAYLNLTRRQIAAHERQDCGVGRQVACIFHCSVPWSCNGYNIIHRFPSQKENAGKI